MKIITDTINNHYDKSFISHSNLSSGSEIDFIGRRCLSLISLYCLLVFLSSSTLASSWMPNAPMDKKLAEGPFVGAGSAQSSTTVKPGALQFYDGPLPADRTSNFWAIFGSRDGVAWSPYVTEHDVYDALLQVQDAGHDFDIGIGKGGQLYSLRGPWGEAMPPQESPWADEVWQAAPMSTDVRNIMDAIWAEDSRETNINNSIQI